MIRTYCWDASFYDWTRMESTVENSSSIVSCWLIDATRSDLINEFNERQVNKIVNIFRLGIASRLTGCHVDMSSCERHLFAKLNRTRPVYFFYGLTRSFLLRFTLLVAGSWPYNNSSIDQSKLLCWSIDKIIYYRLGLLAALVNVLFTFWYFFLISFISTRLLFCMWTSFRRTINNSPSQHNRTRVRTFSICTG